MQVIRGQELRPAILFEPDRVLTIRADLCDGRPPRHSPLTDEQIFYRKLETVEELKRLYGAACREEGSDHVISVPFGSFERDLYIGHSGSQTAPFRQDICSELVRRVMILMPYKPDLTVDRVIGLKHGGGYGPGATIYRSFQAWLDAKKLTETGASEVLKAMQVPFFEQTSGELEWYDGDQVTQAEMRNARLVMTQARFTNGCGAEELHQAFRLEATGDPRIGPNADDRNALNTDPAHKQLYDITAKNVDESRETLAFIFALGTLARLAVESQKS